MRTSRRAATGSNGVLPCCDPGMAGDEPVSPAAPNQSRKAQRTVEAASLRKVRLSAKAPLADVPTPRLKIRDSSSKRHSSSRPFTRNPSSPAHTTTDQSLSTDLASFIRILREAPPTQHSNTNNTTTIANMRTSFIVLAAAGAALAQNGYVSQIPDGMLPINSLHQQHQALANIYLQARSKHPPRLRPLPPRPRPSPRSLRSRPPPTPLSPPSAPRLS